MHTYLNTDAEARAMIDGVVATHGVVATRALVPSAGTKWAAVGHSQGGQAAIGSGELAARAKGLTYVGAVGFAPAQHLMEGIEAIASDKFSAPYLAYMAVGMRATHPGFDYARFVGPLYADRMATAETHCFDEWFYLDNLGLNPTPETALNPGWSQDAAVLEYFAASDIGLRHGAGPVLYLQGTSDGLYATYDAFIGDLCGSGTPVHGISYTNVSHDRVLDTGWADTRTWLADRFAGRPAPSDCPV
jgi:pimeloyl-ACP methyl ester carboxylesterase